MAKETVTTKLCKHCKMEIPNAAKTCPHCRKKQGTNKLVIALIIAAILIFAFFTFAILLGSAALKSYEDTTVIESTLIETDGAATTAAETTEAAISSEEAVETVSTELTMGQKNALSKGLTYLKYSAFSYSGLIKQLEFEQFSTEDATFAADNCGADWNEQATKKAGEYLKIMSFSRDGLINQLIFDGYTEKEAEYGVSAVGY